MNSNRSLLLPTLARTSPIICGIILFINCILNPSFSSFYIFVMYYIIMFLNFFEKVIIFEPLYKFIGKTSIPILGRGIRPDNANSCDFNLDGKYFKTFGMPSGHSQMAWAIATYFISKIIINWYNNQNKDNKMNTSTQYIWLILSCLVILLIAVYISYSRVYIEGCHTIQQVTVGGLLGIVSGFLIYYFENDVIKLMSKIY